MQTEMRPLWQKHSGIHCKSKKLIEPQSDGTVAFTPLNAGLMWRLIQQVGHLLLCVGNISSIVCLYEKRKEVEPTLDSRFFLFGMYDYNHLIKLK